jgi:hypothetical protein
MAAYAGIGSRRTPPEILSLMRQTAAALAARGYTLRTGGAGGADQAFLEGAGGPLGQVELFLPWPGFRGSARPERMEGTLGPSWRTICSARRGPACDAPSSVRFVTNRT